MNNEAKLWAKVEDFFVANFDVERNPPVETLLFLIGEQEL